MSAFSPPPWINSNGGPLPRRVTLSDVPSVVIVEVVASGFADRWVVMSGHGRKVRSVVAADIRSAVRIAHGYVAHA